MAKLFECIDANLQSFLEKQKIFFVATAPLDGNGHVNVSPKGMDTFRIISPTTVAYLDLSGSGNETSANIFENGRVTLMFCAFEGSPKIVRLYGKGKTILPESDEWLDHIKHFDCLPGFRQILLIELQRIQTSCGYSIPFFKYEGERDTLVKWAENKGQEMLKDYQQKNNTISIDGILTPLGHSRK